MKQQNYLVKMYVFDDGTVKIKSPQPTPLKQSYSKELKLCTAYYDVFDSCEKAVRFYNSNKEEIEKAVTN